MLVTVTIHSSQFPEAVRRDLLRSLRSRQINHKFHYDSVRQMQKWLAVHEGYSPWRTDRDCAAIYERAFAAAAEEAGGAGIQIVGLGCGSGQKDIHLARLLKQQGSSLAYAPVDVSVPLVLLAREAAAQIVEPGFIQPLVCDLAAMNDFPQALDAHTGNEQRRLVTFLGMIPNFEPQRILPQLASALRPGDLLLFSANLAPGPDYAAGVRKVLPLYDNTPTRDWLEVFLRDLGVEPADGVTEFQIETCPADAELRRITAHFVFANRCGLRIESDAFEFLPGDRLRLFFSYRYTVKQIENRLERHDLAVADAFVTNSGEEGVFLCRRGR